MRTDRARRNRPNGCRQQLFRDFDNQDFRPPVDYPGKDNGVLIPKGVLDLPKDIAGNPVPAAGVDIGAYQE